jgi:hypothetical protein
MLTAHYFKGSLPSVVIAKGPSAALEHRLASIPVRGKRDARLIAKQWEAQPWNF